MLAIIQLEGAKYCFGYWYEYPFQGRSKFTGNVGEYGRVCPNDMIKVDSVFLTTQKYNISFEAEVTVSQATNATMIGILDKNIRIVSSSVQYRNTEARDYNLSAIASCQSGVALIATNMNVTFNLVNAKNLIGLIGKQKAPFSLNYLRIDGQANCSNASSLLVATQAQTITARQLVTDITLRAPYAAGLVMEQAAQLTISNARMTITVESRDPEKGSAAISMEQREPTTITNSEITATLRGKECAAVAVTQSGVLTITQITVTVTISETKNASGLVVQQSAGITLNAVNVHSTINVKERATGFVVEQQAALTTTNCQINGIITSNQLAAGVVHVQAGVLTITQLSMDLNITASDDPASLIYSAENTISLENITGIVRLTAGNKMVAKLMSVSDDNFRATKANNITVNIQGGQNDTIMCPCFAPNKCLEDATLQAYCGHSNQKYTFESRNTADNWNESFYEFNYNKSEYALRYKYLQPQLYVVKLFTDCSGSGCPDVNNSVIKYNFGNNTTNGDSNVRFSGRDFSTFYIRSSYYNIMILANNMHMSGNNTPETLFGGFLANLIENRQFINCHLQGYIGNNPGYVPTESKFTIGGLVARQNCNKLEFIRCTVDARVNGTKYVGGFLGRQDRGSVFFTNCSCRTTGFNGERRSYFIGYQNAPNSKFVNCSAFGSLGTSGTNIKKGSFVGEATSSMQKIEIINSSWETTDTDLAYATGQKNGGTVTAQNVTYNGQEWRPGSS